MLVYAQERETGLALLDACQACGYHGLWLKQQTGASASGLDVVLWDLRDRELEDTTLVAGKKSALGDIPVIAIIGFPRPDDFEKARELGLAALISKPLEINDLAWQLRRVRQLAED